MRSRAHADLLLRKAAQDEFTVEKLAPDPAAPDEVIGFHAQQAVEKLVKAVLAHAAIHYRRTHDLTELIDLLRDNGEPFPDELDDVRGLTPFATSFRYDDVPVEAEAPFDRRWALDCVQKVRV
jgi:HEPN domain-containing protein